MKRHQYRCDRCLILEDRLLHEGVEPLCAVVCSKCGGWAPRLPIAESMPAWPEDFGRTPADSTGCGYLQPGL